MGSEEKKEGGREKERRERTREDEREREREGGEGGERERERAPFIKRSGTGPLKRNKIIIQY